MVPSIGNVVGPLVSRIVASPFKASFANYLNDPFPGFLGFVFKEGIL